MQQRVMVLMCMMLSFGAAAVRADILVLVHGYMGSAASWEVSGINGMLQASGWQRAGVVAGGQLFPQPLAGAGNSVYAVELPSLAPMMIQADHLQGMLRQIVDRHPRQPLVIVAHSAGGVVARILLVRGTVPNARALITIASPHLGTTRAVQALDATDTPWPFCLVQNFFSNGTYRAVKGSRGALLDLTPAHPGSLLFWLNSQPHPDIAYHSIVTTGPAGIGDELVPAVSQDMNNIPAISGRSSVTTVAAGHGLDPQDGMALVQVLRGMGNETPAAGLQR